MNRKNACIVWLCSILLCLVLPGATHAQVQVPIHNAGFEGPPRQTLSEGTSVSSWLAEGWMPWSILGDSTTNREVEYKLITLETGRTPDLESHVRTGNHAQQFFTNGGSHTAGFYQKVQIPPNGIVTLTVWAQMQTGDNLIFVEGRYVSDLSAGGGNYAVQVGIDPTGATPTHFGAPLPGSIVWSEPRWDITAWGKDEQGNPADFWVPLSVTAKAQGEWIAIYTRGQCKYPTHYNSSFWDDASLTVSAPPTATPVPPKPTQIPAPTSTLEPTVAPPGSPAPTETLSATETAAPTRTPEPTPTVTPTEERVATATAAPTATLVPTIAPTAESVASQAPTWTPLPATAVPTATGIPAAAAVAPLSEPGARTWPTVSWLGLGAVALLIVGAMAAGLFIGSWLAKR